MTHDTVMGALALLALSVACGRQADGEGSLDAEGARDGVSQEDSGEVDSAGSDAQLGDSVAPAFELRSPGQRSPRGARCDAADPARCLLPWPSNVFTVADEARATGVRVSIDPAELRDERDDLRALVRADGFSRVSPIVTAFDGPLDEGTLSDGRGGALRLFVAEPGEAFGVEEPVLLNALSDPRGGEVALMALPARPLRAAAEHLVVVTDALRYADGTAVAPERSARVALGLVAPEGDEERALFAYHAPARALIASAGLDPSSIVRLWDFTTRSAEDPRGDLRALRDAHLAAVDAGEVAVVIDEATIPTGGGAISVIARGRLLGLPSALDADLRLARDELGRPLVVGTHDIPFRVVIPAGQGDYRVVMYAHGTGGDVGDSSFDTLMASHGAAKVGLEIDGWTGGTLGSTLTSLLVPLSGTDSVTARALESLAGGAAIQRALAGTLGDKLSAPTLAGQVNPAAGRRPDLSRPVWAGGSLGGVMGLIYAYLEPTIVGGVLNVPGAGFTHWLPRSDLYGLLEAGLEESYPTAVDLALVIAQSQLAFDPMDGACWVGARQDPPTLLVQISVGDPVLPNVGSNLVATSLDALWLGAKLAPILGLDSGVEARGRSAVTQFKVPQGPDTPALDVHGFAARDTVAGRAAQRQFIDFVETLWVGAPTITLPSACQENTPPNSCDFSVTE